MPYDTTSRGNNKENRYNLAKDCFILSFCLIGMNSVDLYNAEICENSEIVYCRTKTKDRRSDNAKIRIKIHPLILPIIKSTWIKQEKEFLGFIKCMPISRHLMPL